MGVMIATFVIVILSVLLGFALGVGRRADQED